MSAPSQLNIDSRGHGAFVASCDDAPAYWFYGTLWVVLADVHQTGGSYTVMEQWMRGGIGPASHVHNVDEWFFVLEGSMDMQVDGHDVTGKAGDSIWIPRGTDHGFTTTGEGAHVLNGYAPGGVEQIIVGLATPAARRELPPDDLALASEDVLTRMNNNYWSASSDEAATGLRRLRPRPARRLQKEQGPTAALVSEPSAECDDAVRPLRRRLATARVGVAAGPELMPRIDQKQVLAKGGRISARVGWDAMLIERAL